MTAHDDIRILQKMPVLVTAFSDNHFDEAKKNVLPSFRLLSNDTIFVYDLGLNKTHLDEVRTYSLRDGIQVGF